MKTENTNKNNNNISVVMCKPHLCQFLPTFHIPSEPESTSTIRPKLLIKLQEHFVFVNLFVVFLFVHVFSIWALRV